VLGVSSAASLATNKPCTTANLVTNHTTNKVGNQLQALSTKFLVYRIPGLGMENEEFMRAYLPGYQEMFL
jgi:hypothetical protein